MSGSGRLVLRSGVATDTGRVRSINQDSYVVLPDRGLYVVADGMGGAQGGEVASKLAVETLEATYLEPSAEALAEAIAQANHRIFTAADDPGLHGMGTTTVAIALVPGAIEADTATHAATAAAEASAAVDADIEAGIADETSPPSQPPAGHDEGGTGPGQHLLVVNVGDSRAYLFRDGGLTQITDDHSVVAELVREGRITPQEAEDHPQRNIITRVLGVYPEVTPDLWPIDAVRGDRYLLCSDGLFNEVGNDQMGAVLRRLEDPSEAAAELVRLANEGGGRDNITVIVVDVVDDGGVAESASAALGRERRGSSRRPEADLAGFTTASPGGGAVAAPDSTRRARRGSSRSERRAARKQARAARTRLTWRVVIFAVLVVAVIGGAVATVQWYGTSTYYVGFHDDEVAIYQGRPGGLLWIEPTLEQDTGIGRDEVPARYLAALEAGHEHPSLAEASQYVSNIERDIIASTPPTTTTTTTIAPPAPTTVPPPAVAN